jgi:hypothetical protein
MPAALNRNTHTFREAWLADATSLLNKKFFDGNGYTLPGKLACSCGFPKGHRGKAIGQCWSPETSADGTVNMFICPTQDDPIEVLAILLHELIHAQVGTEAGHKGPFKKLMREFGLEGKATATYASPGSDLWLALSSISTALGPYPHKKMTPKAKPSTRKSMGGWVRLKSTTEEEYKVLVSPKQIEEHGMPRDPWGEPMEPVDPDSEWAGWKVGGEDEPEGDDE